VAGRSLGLHQLPDQAGSGAVSIADLGVEPRVFAAGGPERAVKLQRLPEVMRASRDPARPHQAAPHWRHQTLRPQPEERRPPPLLQPDLPVPLIASSIRRTISNIEYMAQEMPRLC